MMSCAEPRPIDSQSSAMDRLEAAHALLGVSPKTVISPISSNSTKLSQSAGGGLHALAALATSSLENHTSNPVSASSNSSSDEDSEAMPPPPPRRRLRSCSNPEGMEKWDSLNGLYSRRRFVLPSSILEEELAEAKAATERKQEEDDRALKRSLANEAEAEQELTPAQLLIRARSRLLEDLSEGSISGQKGELTLPHSLTKYKNVYNKNGRIGIYTPAERAAIISRFQCKRARRVWNKKIRYNCRKNLADRRLRVKGRFVKRSELPIPKLAAPAPDDDMPDVNDPEAGFSPTAEQPFRRLRRHTIT
mmetsp:Transcript_29742/g.45082  ORF Transcript_29742/g.45082 Transcript_29742/m.45082 type:complete len:306 (+) Transcript_29742:1119-2036(+)